MLREFIRATIRNLAIDIMAEEVAGLCGAAYKPSSENGFRRSGGTCAGVRIGGVSERIRRPRVRRHGKDHQREVRPKT